MDYGTSPVIELRLAPSPPVLERSITGTAMAFGRFVAFPSARTLLSDGDAVTLGARAFDLLVFLLEARGTVVSKDAIMRHVWPTTTVDESNLRFQMTSLRRALGEERERIKTITGRGYLFVADDAGPVRAQPPAAAESFAHLPTRPRKPAIVIIDENAGNRQALHRLLQPFDADVQSFVSIEAFLLESGTGLRREELAR